MEIHNDDKPVGRVLTRREMMQLLGGGAFVLMGGVGLTKIALAQSTGATPEPTALPSCVVRPAMTEGPYFVDEKLNRFDIRSDPSDGTIKEGMPLHLKFVVSQIDGNACVPLPGAQVDIWHCDALGVYSDVSDPSFDTHGQRWLRGYQVTDANGVAEFITIYPGWYPGRTVHIHFKIRTDPQDASAYEFVSQVFFPETVTDAVYAQQPYASRGQRNTLNADDGIYRNGGGDQLILDLTPTDASDLATAYATLQAAQPTPEATATFSEQDGYTAIFTIGLDLSKSPA